MMVAAGAAALFLVFALGAGSAFAQGGGGTTKPPPGAVAPWVTPTLPDPVFTTDPKLIHGFDETGFIQQATVSADNTACPDVTQADRLGGTVMINGTTITIPCNSVIQMPANTLKWSAFVNGVPGSPFPTLPTALLGPSAPFPSYEIHVIGNIVASQHIAGLVFVSQQALNSGSGVISRIDYATGNIEVDSGDAAQPAIVQINDPNGRFGRAQSPDERFGVDDQNPTVHAATGYPMCVPRTDPASADDPLCPQVNRPRPSCRNFSQAGVAPPNAGELTPAAPGQSYCSSFVMPAPADATPTEPDATQQAPFEVGDFITYSGTLVHGTSGDYISAHTIEANIGIYTQPGVQPSYLAIGEFGIGTADPAATAVNGSAQETQDRIFLEAETTDVKSPVDIYLMDTDPKTGVVHNRFITPFEMTGENQTGIPTGGITTQNTGAQPQRARLRATKAPTGLLSAPSRMIRVVSRSLCRPAMTLGQPVVDACLNNAPTVANGLKAGQYAAPTFEFIFPENVMPGDPVVPNDLWHLPFLRNGEGADTPGGVGPLEPTPWGGPVDVVAPQASAAGAPAGGGAAAAPAPAPAAAAGGAATVILTPARAAPAPVAAPLAIARLALARPAVLPAVVRASALATAGIPVRIAVPAGARVVRLRVLTAAGRPLAQSFRSVKGGRKITLRLRIRGRHVLRRGRYLLEVTPGRTRHRLGSPSRTAFRVH
jgi:hypothetical protein